MLALKPPGDESPWDESPGDESPGDESPGTVQTMRDVQKELQMLQFEGRVSMMF